MKTLLLILLLFSISLTAVAQDRFGAIAGQVIDEKTLEPLIGVTIQLVNHKKIGAISDTAGHFQIEKIPVGEYSLRCSAVGYEAGVITNVVVTTGRSVKVKAKLTATGVNRNEVTVSADYFRNGGTVGAMSSAVIDGSEVKRLPGSVLDMQRAVQILPGVANSQDQNNELIVRGGDPFENLTVLDYIEIPSTNHYPNEYNSAGPINMVNSDMIEDLEFSTGGFPAQYGDKISSVMKVTLREGDRNVPLAASTTMHFAGIGTLAEGRIDNGRGSWMLSARQSLMDIFDKLVGAESIGITAVPKYWDAQTKVVYDLSQRQKLIFNGIYGNDRIIMDGDPKKKSDHYRNTIDSSSVETVNYNSQQYAAGVTLKSLWGKKGYTTFTLSTIGTIYKINVNEEFTARQFDGNGEVLDYRTLTTSKVFTEDARQSFVSAKFDWFWQPTFGHEISLGGQWQGAGQWNTDLFIVGDTSRYDLDRNGSYETGPIVMPEGNFHERIGFMEEKKIYGYLSDVFHITPTLRMTLGARYDYFSLSKAGVMSPRFNMEYELVPRTTKLKFSAGDYYQAQPFPNYSDRNKIGFNRRLKDLYARSYGIGAEHLINDGFKVSVESFYKKYSDYAVSEEFIYQAIDTLRSERRLNVGRKYAYGVELFLQQKQMKDLYGTISLTWSKARFLDPRQPKLTEEYPDANDYPWIFVLSGGKITKGFRNKLDQMPFFIKYPSYALPFSNDMELGVKFRYQTGRVYTPREFVTWRQNREGGIKWSQGAWIMTTDINSKRYPDYHRLDIQWMSRFHFEHWNLNTAVAIQNVYNRGNIQSYRYRSDGTIENEYQFAFFPVLGMEIEF